MAFAVQICKRHFRSGSRRPGAGRAGNRRAKRRRDRAGRRNFQLPARGRRQAAASGAAAAGRRSLRAIAAKRHPAGRGGRDDPQRHAGSRRRDRRRKHAPRPPERECSLGQPHERPRGRLALHAVVRDGAARTQFRDSRYPDRSHAKHGRRRAAAAHAPRANRSHRSGATELAYRKTACLFSGCARLGAVLGQQPKQIERRFANTAATRGSRFSSWTICSISRRRPSSLASRCSAI